MDKSEAFCPSWASSFYLENVVSFGNWFSCSINLGGVFIISLVRSPFSLPIDPFSDTTKSIKQLSSIFSWAWSTFSSYNSSWLEKIASLPKVIGSVAAALWLYGSQTTLDYVLDLFLFEKYWLSKKEFTFSVNLGVKVFPMFGSFSKVSRGNGVAWREIWDLLVLSSSQTLMDEVLEWMICWLSISYSCFSLFMKVFIFLSDKDMGLWINFGDFLIYILE